MEATHSTAATSAIWSLHGQRSPRLLQPFQLVALCFAVTLMTAAHVLWPQTEAREPIAYGFVASFGYAHFIGAAWFSKHKLKPFTPTGIPPVMFAAFIGVGLLNLYVWYASALNVMNGWTSMSHTWVLLVLLALVTWHTVENELATKDHYDAPGLIGPFPRSAALHLISIGWTCVVLLLVASTLREYEAFEATGLTWIRMFAGTIGALLLVAGAGDGRARRHASLIIVAAVTIPNDAWRWVSFSDVYIGATLYHLGSWLMLAIAKTGRLDRVARRARYRQLGLVHAVPMTVAAVGWVLATPSMRHWIFSPAAYLFWSGAHVVQTSLVRGTAKPA